ncbi:MAG TPA: SBBP repeat-containing protein [Bellilinea sp.]|nr:SBBP repeat-containing protein [Bellilinea sp.]
MHQRIPCQHLLRGLITSCILVIVLALGSHPAQAQPNLDATLPAGEFQLKLVSIPARVENGRVILDSARLNLALPQIVEPLSAVGQLTNNPQLLGSTYLGGSSWDSAYAVAVDSAGAVYVAGETPASNFPTTGGFGNLQANQLDAFLVKIAPGGASIDYAVLLGGGSLDSVFALAVEKGIVYLAGETWSRTFPAGVVPAGENDVWAAAITPDGSGFIYAVRFGGSDQDRAQAIIVKNGRVTLTGVTWSPDFPAPGFHGVADIFVTQLSPTGLLEKSVLLGGSDVDAGFGIDSNSSQILICGQTWSRNFPIRGLHGEDDGFVMLLDENLTLTGGSLIGGTGEDSAYDCAFERDGSILAAGRTASTDLTVAGSALQGEEDAFVGRFDASGSLLEVSRIGADGVDGTQALAVSGDGMVWLTGMTSSANFPTTAGAFQQTTGGGVDAFIAAFKSDNLSVGIQYASYFGGSGNDYAQALTAGPNSLLVMAGFTQSVNFPLEGQSVYSTLNGSQDAYIAWVGESGSMQLQPSATLQPQIPTSTPMPTLSEAEISAAETARPTLAPPGSASEGDQPAETAISAGTTATPMPSQSEDQLVTGTAAVSSGMETSTSTLTALPPVGQKSPLVGWGLGILAAGGIAVAIFVFLRRRNINK